MDSGDVAGWFRGDAERSRLENAQRYGDDHACGVNFGKVWIRTSYADCARLPDDRVSRRVEAKCSARVDESIQKVASKVIIAFGNAEGLVAFDLILGMLLFEKRGGADAVSVRSVEAFNVCVDTRGQLFGQMLFCRNSEKGMSGLAGRSSRTRKASSKRSQSPSLPFSKQTNSPSRL